jgi:hypothetical protein
VKAIGCSTKLDSEVAGDSSETSGKSKPELDLRNDFLLALRQPACAIGRIKDC